MYLHLGNNKIIRKKSIIGIFDSDNCTSSSDTKKFLTQAQKRGTLVSLTDDIPRSFIVTDGEEKGKPIVYMSLLSASALKGRSENNDSI